MEGSSGVHAACSLILLVDHERDCHRAYKQAYLAGPGSCQAGATHPVPVGPAIGARAVA